MKETSAAQQQSLSWRRRYKIQLNRETKLKLPAVLCLSFLIVSLCHITGCASDNPDDSQQLTESESLNLASESFYFPPINSNEWESQSPSALGWDESMIPALYELLEVSNTRSFMVLVNGQIVLEKYFQGHTASDDWQWNSAGKTLVTASVGIAQQQNILDVNNKVSDYIGVDWTSAPVDKENLITVKNLLSMTSGLDDEPQLVVKRNLVYLADAGTRWAYSNVFQILMDVVAIESGSEFEDYFATELAQKIGMDGFWNEGPIYTIYNSTTRSVARFGLLALQEGFWDGQQIVNEGFFADSVSTSQEINSSYGYMWWLNGKSSYIKPGEQTIFQGKIVPDAPEDMYAAMGAKEQRLYIVPSKKMVVVRLGERASTDTANFALSGFDSLLWRQLNLVIDP